MATEALAPAVTDERLAELTGRIAAGSSGLKTSIFSPLNGELLGEITCSTPEDVAAAVDRARAAQPAWAARGVRARARVVLKLHDLALARREEWLDLVQAESGKSRINALEELIDLLIHTRYYSRRAPRLLRDSRRRSLLPGLTRVREIHHPIGVVGIISPWNYPLTLAISDLVPALLAGNAVVLKPDTQTALTALFGARLLDEAGLPPDVLQVVVGQGDVVGPAVVDGVDQISFTGSTATGRVVARQAGSRLIGASLELGGKNAAYVARDADLGAAAATLVRDCFSSAGQLCVSVERLVLHESIAEDFLARFVPLVHALGDTAGVGSLTTREQLHRVEAQVTEAVDAGATVLAGARARADLGPLVYEPTVLDAVPDGARCLRQETFGPVVVVHRVADDEQALALVNDSEYGLNAQVWSRDRARGEALARRITTGTVSVNDGFISWWASIDAPMGGRKASGLGHRHGAEGLLRFTSSQTIAVQRWLRYDSLYRLGPGRFAALMLGALRVARAGRLPWP